MTSPDGHRYGFDGVSARMEMIETDSASRVRGAARVLGVVVRRLEGTGDLELVAQRRALFYGISLMTVALGLSTLF